MLVFSCEPLSVLPKCSTSCAALLRLIDWLHLVAGMPQGSYLGPLTFIILTDALRPGCLTHKYVDDTTMTKILEKSAVSGMRSFIDELVQQSSVAGMIVNGRKMKEMLVSTVLKDPPPYVTLSNTPVQRITSRHACTLRVT